MRSQPLRAPHVLFVLLAALILLAAVRPATAAESHSGRQAAGATGQPAVARVAASGRGRHAEASAPLRFHFHFQPWDRVLDWLAAETGLPIRKEATPRGTLNYSDDRPYTTAEAIDLINRMLAPKGYSLVRRGEALVLIRGTVPPGHPPATADASPRIVGWEEVEDFPTPLALFETVFWDPRDTVSLRRYVREQAPIRGKTVLEIGTGSGLLALCCLKAGASRVVATDVNPSAIQNAAFNAARLGLRDRLELRQVPLDDPGAWSVIKPSERFDLIVANPPWEDSPPARIEEYALYDNGFQLLQSLLDGLEKHLKPGGTALLAYGCVDAIRTAQRLAGQNSLELKILDRRDLNELPYVFLPGMLLAVAPR